MDTVFKLEAIDSFQNASREVLSSLYHLDHGTRTQLEPDIYETAKQDIRKVISDCDFDVQNVISFMNNKGWDRKKVDWFNNLIEKKWPELLRDAYNHYSSNFGETVINIDWLVKFIFGTSELKTLKYPLLQLILVTVNKVGHQNRVSYDINKPMLLKMINILENISQ